MNITRGQFVDIILESEWFDLAKIYYEKHYPNLVKETNFLKKELKHICSEFPKIASIILCEPLATEYKPIHDKLLEIDEDIKTDKIFGSKDLCCICRMRRVRNKLTNISTISEGRFIANSKRYWRHDFCLRYFIGVNKQTLSDVEVVEELVKVRRTYAKYNPKKPMIFDPSTMTTSALQKNEQQPVVIKQEIKTKTQKELSMKEKHIQYFLEELSRPYFRKW